MPARLSQVLVSRGLLSPERASEALRQLALSGGNLDTVLLEHGWVPELPLLQALGEASGRRPVNLADFEPNLEVAQLIPPKIAERLCVAPLSVDGPVLHVACGYPIRKAELDEVAFLLGKQLDLWVAVEVRVRDWISQIYRQPLAARFTTLVAQAGGRTPASHAPAPVQAEAQVAGPVEESTLEDSLTREMVDRLAQSIAEEPIPLEVRKARPAPLPEAALDVTPPDATAGPPIAPTEALPEPRLSTPGPSAPPPTPPERRDVEGLPAPPLPSGAAAWAAGRSALEAAPAQRATERPPSGGPAADRPLRLGTERAPTISEGGGELEAAPPRHADFQWGVSSPHAPAGGAGLPKGAATPEPAPLAPGGTLDAVEDEIPTWSLAEARSALREAAATGERERVIDVALSYARRTFDFAAAFVVLRGAAVGWDARGENASREQIAQVSIPLDATSVFRTVALSRGSFTGPVPPESLNLHYLRGFGRQPRALFLFPVEVKTRLVALVYGDAGQRPFSQRRLSDYLLFCQELPGAFQELILRRKQLGAAEVQPPPEPISPAPQPPPAPSAPAGLGWSPWSSASSGRTGRAASLPAMGIHEAERPPPDFNPLLRRLTGPDPTERARAMAELARAPEASARFLASVFPGPTAWSRLPVMELPEADELGPIPGALARLGRAGAGALAPLLDADDSDARYLALLTAGNLPFPELVDGVLRGLFDLEPDISSAARAAATALRRLPRFDGAMKDLRQELTSRDPLRRGLAARALGVLHDREAIDGLIGLTSSDDQLTAQAAAEALREITRQSFGIQPRQWLMWWAENRRRRRVEWLVTALRHPDVDLRTSAIEELTRVLNDSLGYAPDGPAPEREAAVRRWEGLLAQGGRWQRLEV